MAESTLSLDYTDLMEHTARFLGIEDTYDDMSAAEKTRVDRVVQSGYRQFLYPPLLPNHSAVHAWSFLCPVAELSLTSGDGDVDAPDDFGSLVGPMTFSSSSNRYAPVAHTGEGTIRGWLQMSDTSGHPRYVAVRPKTFAGATESARYEFLFYPTPDASYTLNYRYNVLVNKLSESAPYPICGMAHMETLLASCLAAAERDEDEAQGVQYARFMERLGASIEVDVQSGAAGLGMDDASGVSTNWDLRHTYDGTLYD